MDEHISRLAAGQGNVVLRRQLLDAGYSDNELYRLRQRGELVLIRRGAYAETRIWDVLDDLERHKALVRAVLLQIKAPAVPSHISAAVMLGLRLWKPDLSVVHVTRTDLHSTRREAGVLHHGGALSDADLAPVDDGVIVTAPHRTAIDVARVTGFEPAVVVADAALTLLANDHDLLLRTLDRMRDWPGARAAGRVVEFADGLSESVGESRARVQFERVGLPRPRLQIVIGTENQDRVDFLFEDECTVVEFDGRLKYGRLLAPGTDASDAVWREKRREDRIREQGFGFARLVWADLYRDDVVRKRLRRAFSLASRQPASVALS
ncbi:type IV toxin-antitoxin system AbiEi family antitoxin domain-containing protein [Jiangella endophytica]|uniref:type IV toxin-antitoxin system AbiEi family antitoxin domain-containing protein n=1 Tax=Jiangella endophytica TaxID=1623398 RepID=UPI00130071AB|nr:type IV toxin-antitoxin system AbiEi family antitoxin domain-containing protein [Jiangella endophytica]